MVHFKEIYHFSRFQGSRGVQHFSGGGSSFFQGGSNCLFPIETHVTRDFLGGSCPPPLDTHLCCIGRRMSYEEIEHVQVVQVILIQF